MVRTYHRKYTNARNGKNHQPYLSYSKSDLEKAIDEIQNGSLTLTLAAEKYNVPKSTLSRKCRNKNCTQEKAGHPTLFSKGEEIAFLDYIKLLSSWGFPLDSTDLRVFAQKYLNKIGKTVYSLKDNMPGVDWARNFINRHKSEISNRQASNISNERAKITPSVIDDFFSYYEKTVEGVSQDCLINYDETNLTDDPGNKKYLFKRGCKYPERVINSTKTSTSLMFSGTADGQLLPIYVVYKAEHLWDQWMEGGPTGTRYNRSKSGWFDSACFEDWFNSIIVPYAKTKGGRKVVLIGDNLSSHFSQSVLQTCQELNIRFVCLPPKTTHLLQPLDVAFYAPLKKYWRDVLTQWKKTDGFNHKTLLKSSFPKLLARLYNKLAEKGSDSSNITAGFNKCGLYPVCPDRPKSRLPQTNDIAEEHNIQNTASAAIVEILKEMRNPTAIPEPPKRKKKCNVPPGQSITAEDLQKEQNQPIELQQSKRKCSTNSRQNKRKYKKTNTISYKTDRSSSTDSDKTRIIEIDEFSQPIAGPSGLRQRKKQTTSNNKHLERSNKYDGSQNKKSKLATHSNDRKTKQPVTSFISNKGKGEGKKSKIATHTTDNIEKYDTEINERLNAATTIAKFIRKKAVRKSSISSTSVSDLMSVYSDSDLLDVDFGKSSSDMNDDNNYENSEMPRTSIKDSFYDKEIEKSKQDETSPLVFFDNEGEVEEIVDGEKIDSSQLVYFDNHCVVKEVVVEEDAVELISFNEKELYNNNVKEMDDKKSNKVMDNKNMIDNKENHIEIGKRVTVIREERIEDILPLKKGLIKNLRPYVS